MVTVFGLWVAGLEFGFKVLGAGGFGFKVQGLEFRVLRHLVQGLGFGVTSKGFSSGLKFLNENVVPARFGLRGWKSGFGV